MREQSPDQYVDKSERQFDRRTRLRALLSDLALSALMIAPSSSVRIAFEEMHRTESLLHD